MKVSKSWLKELVEIKSIEEVEKLLPLKTIATKEVNYDFIELDMKGYNRADLLSLRGVAYEVAAITSSSVNFTEVDQFIWTEKSLDDVKIVIESELCSVYCIAKIEGLKVGPSEASWVKKLQDTGFRPVNNLADITNLVMAEYGQPLHAFDATRVENQTLIVRTAQPGEKLLTLDGKERNLDSGDLLISDPQKPLALAGVMGGKDSEVSNSTTTILLEAAIFDPINTRKTTTRHNLPSEASKRFQHGLTKKRLLQALDAAIKMYKSLGGTLTAISLTGDFKEHSEQVKLTQQKVNNLIGVEINPEQIEEYLQRLGFHPRGVGTNVWEVEVPYWRLDINIEEDLVEEIARMYGYEKIPAKPLTGKLPKPLDQSFQNLILNLKTSLVKIGLIEVQTYSFYSTQTLQALGWTMKLADEQLIKIANPISSETQFMRENIWSNLVEVAGKNLKQGFRDIAIFEVGKVYWIGEDKKPQEGYRLSLALMNSSDNPIPELYQILEATIKDLKLDVKLKEQNPDVNNRLFHPIRHVGLLSDKEQIGGMAEVHPRLLHDYGIDKRVAILEIELVPLLK